MSTSALTSKKLLQAALAALLLASLGAVLYFSFAAKSPRTTPASSATVKEDYYCPMHPSYHSDKPGNCPVCAMKLVKVETPASAAESPAATKSSEAMAPPSSNAIYIAPQKQQLTGMQSVVATIEPLVREIRTVGKVAFDETKVTHVHTKVSGYVEDVFADYLGKTVRKGEPLFTIYSPDLVATQQEYLLALKSRDVLKDSSLPAIATGSVNLLSATRERLRLWDVTEEEIQRLEKGGTVKRAIAVHSPVSGVVTERAAYHHGTFVDPQMELFTIVDLSRVWVLGEVYEYELPFVRIGQIAQVEFPYAQAGTTLQGRVSFVSPFLDPKTRTAQFRIEFPNHALSLKPDMFVSVRLNANLGNQLVVPQDAVLNTGTEQYVFVDLGQGYVEPRRVELGPSATDVAAIRKGLKPGEKVVTAANFIVDAESRLKGAFANMGKPVPVPAGQEALAAAATITITEPKQPKVGRNSVRISVKDAEGKAVEGAEVEISLFMPPMGSMPPMTAKATLQNVGGGEYTGSVNVPMAWTWQTTVTARKGGRTLGSTQTTLTAR